jgi:hypothetical protein
LRDQHFSRPPRSDAGLREELVEANLQSITEVVNGEW